MATSTKERRRKQRLKIPQMVRVRPSGPTQEPFDEILPTVNATKNGVYFVPQNGTFEPNMRVFITYPYDSGPGAINQECLGRVVRVDKLPANKQGVAVEFLMPIYIGAKETIR
jgi:PilZ domain